MSSEDRILHVPSNPVDPVAAEIAAFFNTDETWQGLTKRPAHETRAAFESKVVPSRLPALDHVEDFAVPTGDATITVRFYRPSARPDALIVWAHGGGFVLGNLEECDAFVRLLAQRSGCAVASVDYRLAPEYRYPAAIDDVLNATQWLAARLPALAGASIPMLLAGDSAGANLATVVTRKLHHANGCAIAGQLLAYPCTDTAEAESLRRFDPPFLNLKEMEWFYDQYLPDREARNDPDFAPVRAADLESMPPTFILTAEHDILTEQAEQYGRRLRASGVDVEMKRYPGMIHGFLTMDVFFANVAGEAIDDMVGFIRKILTQE